MRLEFHPDAEAEFVDAAEFYEKQVAGLGERFAAEVRHATEMLLAHPELGKRVDGLIRTFVLSQFPYALYYSVTAEALRIEAVAHQRRRPGYWRSRG